MLGLAPASQICSRSNILSFQRGGRREVARPESLSARVTLTDEYIIHDKPHRMFSEPKDIISTYGSKCHTSVTGGIFLESANISIGLL